MGRHLCLEQDYDSTPEGYLWQFDGIQENENLIYDPATPFKATVDCSADLQIPPQAGSQWGHDIKVQVWMWRKTSEQYPIGPTDKADINCVGQSGPSMYAYNPDDGYYGYYY